MRALKTGLPLALFLSSNLAGAVAAKSNAAEPRNAASPTAVGLSGKVGGYLNSAPDFAAMTSFVDKLFPAQPAPDPKRLALAQTSVAAMWPDGAYGKMMMSLLNGIFDQMIRLKPSDLEGIGVKSSIAGHGGNANVSLHDKAVARDPYFNQRVAAMRQAVSEEVDKVSGIVDPSMRDGLARATARRFDAQQLAEINRFFATPTGKAFAGQYMQLWVDADTMRSVVASVPQIIKLMPELEAKLKAAQDKFPKPSAADDTAKKP